MHITGHVSKGHLVTVFELGLFDLNSVELGAIGSAQILNEKFFPPTLDGSMMARYGSAGKDDEAVRVAADCYDVCVEFGFDLNAIFQGEHDAGHVTVKKGSFRLPASFPLNYRMQRAASLVWFEEVVLNDLLIYMSAHAIKIQAAFAVAFRKSAHFFVLCLLLVGAWAPWAQVRADELEDVETAIVKLAGKHEKAGFDFRADIWERELTPELGKAVRVQFFKGNEYRVCVAVSPKSGVQIAAHVLDAEGRPMESKIETEEGAWGATLHVTPKRTGVYVVVVRHAGGKEKPAICAMITGYK